jgi:hypothetical protein
MVAKLDMDGAALSAEWQLASSATLGSAVRMRGILLEVRARLPLAVRKRVELESSALVLQMPETDEFSFKLTSTTISKVLSGIDDLPLIPREAEDILTISSAERHRWLKDGRLKSAGTRTVKLRGRARAVTFHVFNPREIEDILDRDLVSLWREEDALAAAENRRRAAGKAARTRADKNARTATKAARDAPESNSSRLQGWDDFDLDGLLR